MKLFRAPLRCKVSAVFGLAIALLIPAGSSFAQVTLGHDLKLNKAQGELGVGYSDSYGNLSDSSHGIDGSLDGQMDGYFYNPKLLSFNLHSYYGESRQNSSYQSISDSSGVTASSALFTGTRFPGSIAYSKSYNSFGNFAVPGLQDFTTHGNNQSVGIGWGVNIPSLPSLSVNFNKGSGSETAYGTNAEGHSSIQSLGVRSSYGIAGFALGAGYNHSTTDVTTPEVVTLTEFDSKSGSDNINLTGSHALPLKGQFSSSYSHNDATYQSVFAGSNGNLKYQNASASASFHPLSKLNLSATTNYNDNIGGEYDQQILNQGGILTNVNKLPSSYSINTIGLMSYQFTPDLNVEGSYQHAMQHWSGADYRANYISGGVGYGRKLWRGVMNTNVSAVLSMPDNYSKSVGFSNTSSYGRRFGRWDFSGSGSYSQDMQTVLITYLTSSYSLTANVRRKVGKLFWFSSAGLGHSGLTTVKGDASGSESYATGFSTRRWVTATGSYQRSHGVSFLGANGSATDGAIIPVVTPAYLYQFTGDSYSVAVSSAPIPRLHISASYSRSLNTTSYTLLQSQNKYSQLSAIMQYRVRKLNVVGGYTKLTQGFGGSGSPEANVSAFYIGITRWFKLF